MWVEGRKEGYSGSDKRGKFLKKLWCCVGGRVQLWLGLLAWLI